MNKMMPTSGIETERYAEGYRHPEASAALRPDAGTQAQFRKKKVPTAYRYDSSLAPTLDWDGQNPAREQAEAKIAALQDGIAQLETMVAAGELSGGGLAAATKALAKAREDAAALKTHSRPFLNWAGKAERISFDVPTLPLFVHERLSTAAILETLKGHSRDRQPSLFDLFGESDLPLHDRLLKAYEHQDGWVNRLILGDSLVVMNSLIGYEGLGGQVQTIYVDPPYAVKFGSNFQPFVRKRGRDSRRGRGHGARTGDGASVPGYLGTRHCIPTLPICETGYCWHGNCFIHRAASSCRCRTPTCIMCAR